MSQKGICRACGSRELSLVLSLGETPLANSLLEKHQLDQPEPRYPLDLAFCKSCTLLQITETVPPEKLFSEYLYFSSFSDTMLKHAEAAVAARIAAQKLGPSSLAMEVASNDGYLLQFYKRQGVPVLGIEPALNIAKVAESERGIRTVARFFGRELGLELARAGERADVLHANNVLAHVADLPGFVAGVATVLKPEGLACIEVPYAHDFLQRCEFDTIYHEHLCYFSLTALVRLFGEQGLVIADVERLPIHGGSIRLLAGAAKAHAEGERVRSLLDEEKRWGVFELSTYAGFAERVSALRNALRGMLTELKRGGKRIAAYGAAAKGATLLNTFGIGRELVDFVVDRSTYKQGRYMPGVHLPISPPSRLVEDKPDYCLLLTWNFADEILEQQREYRALGGKFIIPIPEIRVTG